MIISRTPLRMSFVGGGSDLPSFYRKYGGAVVSTAINKYIYVNVNPKFDSATRIAYSKVEEVESIENIEHNLVRATMKQLGISGGVEITTIADIPSKGTGLGSSSTFLVGLINALRAFQGKYTSQDELARESCHIEIDVCGEPIGKQDQYAAAYGGLNYYEFKEDDTVLVNPIICKTSTQKKLNESIIVFYTGLTRSASALLKNQNQVIEKGIKDKNLLRMVDLAKILRWEIQKDNADSFGDILHENWMLKKELSEGISNTEIDEWYEKGRLAGALGGKILGAGAGGFLMFYAPPDKHDAIAKELSFLKRVPMEFEPYGSQIIFFHRN